MSFRAEQADAFFFRVRSCERIGLRSEESGHRCGESSGRQFELPEEIMFSSAPPQLVALARKAAAAQSLDPALVCAVVEHESGWNPWAMRYEPAFFAKYVASLYTNNKVSASEAYARGFSWGLMQVMGQVARETGFDSAFLSELCDPDEGLAVGCRVLRRKFDAMGGDTTRALLAWNGGANPAYPTQVLARRPHYL